MKKISVIITHFRKPDVLRLCIRSVQKALKDIDSEIIVVDSMTMSQTVMMMREEFDTLLYIQNRENTGYAKLVNQGIRHSTGEYLLVLNSDLVSEPDAISKMIAFMDQHQDVGMLGPRLRYFNNEHQQSFFRFYTPWTILARRTPLVRLRRFSGIESDFLMKSSSTDEIQTPDWIMGSSMMTRRSVVDQIGGMDEGFFMYFEDVDWCRRVWHNGHKVVYLPEAVMYHYLGRASKSGFGIFDALFNRHTRWHIKSALRFFMKYRNLGIVQTKHNI